MNHAYIDNRHKYLVRQVWEIIKYGGRPLKYWLDKVPLALRHGKLYGKSVHVAHVRRKKKLCFRIFKFTTAVDLGKFLEQV